jgi:ArsR family transcriptional regulator
MPKKGTPAKPAAKKSPGVALKVASSGCAAKLRVLADPTRLAVLETLIDGPKHVGAIQKILSIEQSLLSHHLQTLREANLVESRRDGKAVLYSISAKAIAPGGEAIDLECCVLSFKN